MTMQTSLQGLRLGQSGRVTEIGAASDMRERLTELGFTSGSEVRCLYAAMSGDPRAYRVCGAVIALRERDARLIGCEAGGCP